MTIPLISHLKSKVLKVPKTSSNTKNTNTKTNTNTNLLYNLYNATTTAIRNQVQSATHHEIKQAIADAKEAQQTWYHDYTPTQKSQILLKISNTLAQPTNTKTLLHMEVNDTGRPINEIQSYDIPTSIETIAYYSYMTSILPSGQMMSHLDSNQSFAYTTREPIGVTIGIGAWNYPLVNVIMKSIPSLIFGNSMIYKPSELTPSSALFLAQVYEDCGLPKGAFQVLLGDGKDVGKVLLDEYCGHSCSHGSGSGSGSGSVSVSDDDTCYNNNNHGKISFTGSLETGRQIASQAAAYHPKSTNFNFHRLNLELGGKSPLIIMEDCDIDDAVSNAINANWYSNGQVCSNGTRVFVHESIYESFISKLVSETKKLKIGNPLHSDVDIGPMISKHHMERVLQYVDIGKFEDGATLLYGGERVQPITSRDNDSSGSGYFISPAIFTDCNDDMRIVQEEVFGMLMSVLTFKDEEEVIQRANATNFGLAAGIITNDNKRAHRIASRLKAGTVWINNYNTTHLAMPWGAVKQSGIGSENGTAAMQAWTTEKVIFVDMKQ